MAPPGGAGSGCSLWEAPNVPPAGWSRVGWVGAEVRGHSPRFPSVSMDLSPHPYPSPSCLCCVSHPPGLGMPWDTS